MRLEDLQALDEVDRYELAEMIVKGRMLADTLDRLSERCAAKAHVAVDDVGEWDLLARAATYQECAGLIRQALK